MTILMRLVLSLFAICCVFSTSAQNNKTIHAHRIANPPKIDGDLNDAIWEEIAPSGNFNMFQPSNEGSISNQSRTEVKMAYDNKAVYVAAYMFDKEPKKILKQFSQRDDVFVQADFFSIALNTYNDGINETRFFITSAGTIGDARADQFNEDFSYNVVFEAKTTSDEKGWYAEFKIPYNALRFPESEIQDWSVNFYRRLTRQNQTHSWSRIDNSVGQQTQYNGLVQGVRNINPPVRLTFFPFVQGDVSHFEGEFETNLSAGMDVKYGLNDSFTLDATLIPDFGQASFDNVRLNLGPFEQTFDENRQFFTEGTELFNKGNIFFSRRVGNAPSENVEEEDLAQHEFVENEPQKVNLLNAIKVSGRTQDNLGVGFFNAVTERTEVTIKDSISGKTRTQLVEPLANYNVFVVDQLFNKNSSISLINTNVTRSGSKFRDANTSALAWNLTNNANSFRLTGRTIMSQLNLADSNVSGFASELDFDRIKGQFRYGFGHDLANKTYDINDFGVNFTNNYNNFRVSTSFQIFKPTAWFNEYRIRMVARHRRLYDPSIKTQNSIEVDWFFATKERLAFGGFANYNSKNDDYFEPRVDGRFVTFRENVGGRVWVSSDYRKKFAYDISVGMRDWIGNDRKNFELELSPRYRFSDKLLMILSSEYSVQEKNIGYVNNDEDLDRIYFGQRDITSLENSINLSYNFNPFKAINLKFRNFWSTANYAENVFSTLNVDGTRTQNEYLFEPDDDPNTNFNIWNLDLSFNWRFAPGSEATLLYRNQIFNQDELSSINYTESMDNLFNQPIQHNLSLRVVYFLDINNFKRSS
ncbi:DUF5916 domain-containing protein [Aquimarina sp. W85]|uniref:DUF5916 domain-containing protein n=1 Tax=Aquimarina rhodophyticola TaxID=3342246 RepID=UPI00366C131D